MRERFGVAVGPDAGHQRIAGDADEHVPAQHERDAAEHRLLDDVVARLQQLADALRESGVVCHQSSLAIGSEDAGG